MPTTRRGGGIPAPHNRYSPPPPPFRASRFAPHPPPPPPPLVLPPYHTLAVIPVYYSLNGVESRSSSYSQLTRITMGNVPTGSWGYLMPMLMTYCEGGSEGRGARGGGRGGRGDERWHVGVVPHAAATTTTTITTTTTTTDVTTWS